MSAADNSSFLLLKPDAVRQNLVAAARAAVAEHGGAVAVERVARLERPDLELLWPLTFADHPLTMELLEGYVCGPPLPLLVVSGNDSLQAARSAKRDLRRRYARGLLANVVHAPDDAEEAADQLRLLTTWPREERSSYRGVTSARHRGANFRELGIDDETVHAAAAKYLRQWAVGAGVGVTVEVPGPRVVLLDDRVNTLDSAVAGLLTVFPDLGVHRAVRIVMTVDARGSAPVVACAPADWTGIQQRLAAAGLPNTALEPA
jgi:nucleoside diphosphate kinase/ATP-dependent Clp protease adapter protein ClpS